MKHIFYGIVVLITATLQSQVSFEASVSRKSLGVNERLRVDFTMNQNGDNFSPPDFKDFMVVGGPNQSVSRQWVNGKSSFNKTFTYFLQPNRTGTLTIQQAQITIEGEVYKTSPLQVSVTGAVKKPDSPESKAKSLADENLHLVAQISNANPYVNEGILVTYKLFVSSRISVNGTQPVDNPKFADFWSQMIPQNNYVVRDEEYNGEPYKSVVLQQAVLYPQKSGKLLIEPLTLSVNVDVPTNRRDFFGNRRYRTVEKRVSAGGRSINVKELPQENKPEDFTGAVGSFNFDVTTSKNSLQAQESLQLEIKVAGNGNLKLFNLPGFTTPPTLEVYEPEHEENVRTNASGMRGNIKDRYTIVPQAKGKFTIDPIRFSYFNPTTEQYQTLESKEFVIDVTKGPDIPSSSESASASKQAVTNLGNDFRYIKQNTQLMRPYEDPFFRSTLFWGLLAAPILFLPLFILAKKKRDAIQGDVKTMRIRKADKLARKYLGEAKKSLGSQKAFYEALERALHNYLKAKLSIQTSEMSKDRIARLLDERNVEQQLRIEFISLLESCEFARYTPSSNVAMQQDYDKAVRVISLLDKQL